MVEKKRIDRVYKLVFELFFWFGIPMLGLWAGIIETPPFETTFDAVFNILFCFVCAVGTVKTVWSYIAWEALRRQRRRCKLEGVAWNGTAVVFGITVAVSDGDGGGGGDGGDGGGNGGD